MTENVGLGLGALADLRGMALVEALEGLDPAGPEAAALDADELAAAVDPRQLRGDGVVRLLAALTRLTERGAAGPGLAGVHPERFAGLVARASRGQLDQVGKQPELRALLLGEIFRRMPGHLRTDRAAGVEAVVLWRLSGGAGDDGYDRYQTVIADGACTAGASPAEGAPKPRVTITLGLPDFVRLITHQATPALLFVTGKIKVKGDLAFAAGLTGYFDLPKP